MVHHRFNWKRYQCFVQMVCHKAGPPPSWVPAFAGKTREGCGNDGGGRWYTTDSTGNGTSASSRWCVTRPGSPRHLGCQAASSPRRGSRLRRPLHNSSFPLRRGPRPSFDRLPSTGFLRQASFDRLPSTGSGRTNRTALGRLLSGHATSRERRERGCGSDWRGAMVHHRFNWRLQQGVIERVIADDLEVFPTGARRCVVHVPLPCPAAHWVVALYNRGSLASRLADYP